MDLGLLKILAAGIVIAGLVAACHERDNRLIQKGVDSQIALEAAQKEKDKVLAEKKDADQAAALRKIDEQRVKENKEHEKTIAQLQRDVRSGAERLRIATVHQPSKTPADPTAGRVEPEEGSVVVPEVASDILGIAAGIGQNVRDYNDLLDAYHALELRCQ